MTWEELERKYPHLLAHAYPEIPDRWFHIADVLLGEIQSIQPKVRVLQIKEKFGGLRCYLETSDREAGDSFCSDAEMVELGRVIKKAEEAVWVLEKQPL